MLEERQTYNLESSLASMTLLRSTFAVLSNTSSTNQESNTAYYDATIVLSESLAARNPNADRS